MASRILLFSGALLLPLVVGCSSRGGAITLDSHSASKILEQSFNQAYITQSKSGEFDIVLVDSAADWEYRQPKNGKPLQPTSLAPLRQVMHIHLFWRPISGTTKNPAAINASIDWYVLGPNGSSDVLIYRGAGYVSAESAGRTRTVRIRDGRIQLTSSRGSLQDPVGSATISGKAVARPNATRVKDVLTELQAHAKLASN